MRGPAAGMGQTLYFAWRKLKCCNIIVKLVEVQRRPSTNDGAVTFGCVQKNILRDLAPQHLIREECELVPLSLKSEPCGYMATYRFLQESGCLRAAICRQALATSGAGKALATPNPQQT